MKALCSALLLIVLCAHEAGAQDYPSRAIRIVVAYPPGGITDTIARIVGQKISENTGQPVVVENKPGASGLVGSQAAISAAPDGYTLLLATPTVEAQPRFDPTRDALPITMVARTSVALSTRTDGPLNSVAALVAAAKHRRARSHSEPPVPVRSISLRVNGWRLTQASRCCMCLTAAAVRLRMRFSPATSMRRS